MRFLVLSACALTLCLAGCGEEGAGTATVSGKVTANGEKVNAGTLMFSPVAGGVQPVGAPIKEDGTYTVSGAGAGKNKVSFAWKTPDAPVVKPGEVGTGLPPSSPYQGFKVKTADVELKGGANTVDVELAP